MISHVHLDEVRDVWLRVWWVCAGAGAGNFPAAQSCDIFRSPWYNWGLIFQIRGLAVINLCHLHLVLLSSIHRCHPQFWDRIKLYMMPSKHQPDFSFLRHVPLRRVHLFTLIQIICLAVLWTLKSTFLAIIFPVMVWEGAEQYFLNGHWQIPYCCFCWQINNP